MLIYVLVVCCVLKPIEYYISRRLFRGYWINKYPSIWRNTPVSDKGLPILAVLMTLPVPFLAIVISLASSGTKYWKRGKKKIQLSFVSINRPADLIIIPPELHNENRKDYSKFNLIKEYQIPHTPRIKKALTGNFLPTKRA